MRWVIPLVGLSLGVCGCSTHATHNSLLGADIPPYSRQAIIRSHDFPTPQFIMINADIAQGRLATVRLRQSPAWNARQNRSMLVGGVEGSAPAGISASQALPPISDKALRAISAAFEHAHMDRDTPQHHLLQPWLWSAPEARFDPREAGR